MTRPRTAAPTASGALPVVPSAVVPGPPDVDALVALVLTCPAVAGLSGGPWGSAATYLPGRKVSGVRIGDDAVEVHPVLAYGETVAELGRQVRRALTGHVGARSLDIVVEDVELPGEDAPPQPPGGQARSHADPGGRAALDPQLPQRATDIQAAAPLFPASPSPSPSGRATPTDS